MKKKILALAMAAIMLIVAVVGGTLAYFTDTDAEVNVFTVGNIDIDLREHKDYDLKDDFEDVKGVMPGTQHNKIVDVENIGDNNAYVRVTINVPTDMIPVWNADVESNWTELNGKDLTLGESGEYVFAYNYILTPGEKTPALLEAVKLSETVTELNAADKYEVPVSVAAIQADSFAGLNDAMEVLKNEENVAMTVFVSDVVKINTELAKDTKAIVQLTNEVKSKTYIDFVNKESILDGNGYAIVKGITDDTTNAGVKTAGGTIKNITISGQTSSSDYGFRAVYATSGLEADLIIDNAELSGSYAINITGSGDYRLVVKNDSILNGWTSYGTIKSAEFTDVTFGVAEGYAHLRPYTDTILTNCEFADGFTMASDAGAKDNFTITITDCKYNGDLITAENFQSRFGITYDGSYAEELIKQATVVVNGVTVVWAD